MEELKKLELNNKSLDDFDKLMNFHLDKIEELEINEINISPKLYNLISLCTNLKQLVVKGDLRSDINKIFFNICNPENIETIILDSVKLPTNKTISKFTNLSTLSLNNITFSDLIGFFNKIPNTEKVIALNLTNVDFGKRSISVLSKFVNLKYLNLDNLKNCLFDNLDFIYDLKKLTRFEFCNNEIGFENINSLTKGRYNKKINLLVNTSKKCDIQNFIKINDKDVTFIVNTFDLDELVNKVTIGKLTELYIVLENDLDITKYIKKFKKVKEKVILAIKDISYFGIEDAENFRDRLDVEYVNVLENPKKLDFTDEKQCYSIDDYIKIREEVEKIESEVNLENKNELEKFNKIYNFFKNNIKYSNEETDLKDLFINKKSSYSFYALGVNSILKELDFESKVISGVVDNETRLWNQVKINKKWYNFDISYELKAKYNKKFLQYAFKSNLLSDEQFYKTHIPSPNSKPEICDTEIQETKKEIKKEQNENKIGFWKMIYQKIVSIFKFNKKKALPSPEEDKKI